MSVTPSISPSRPHVIKPLEAPTLRGPSDGSQLLYNPSTGRKMTVYWQGVPEANEYLLEVQAESSAGSMTHLVWQEFLSVTTRDTQHTFTFGGPVPGRWRVYPLDTTGAHFRSRPTAWWHFQFDK